jgi:hypothetical protein
MSNLVRIERSARSTLKRAGVLNILNISRRFFKLSR